MPTHCCVPACTKKGYSNENGVKVSFFKFLTENPEKKKWLHAIRREEGKHFKVTKFTKISSRHFREGEIKKTLAGKSDMKSGVVPSVFSWVRTSPRKRKPPTERNFGTSSSSSAARKLDTSPVIVTEEPHSFENDDENFAENHDENTQCTSAAKIVAETQTEPQVGSEVAKLMQQILELKAKLENANRRIEALQKQLFTINRFKDDDSSVRFYTGFHNWHTVSAVYNYLNPGVEGENITYWLSQSNLAVPADFYEDEEKEEPSRKRGRSRSLRPIDKFFVVLCRLR